MTIPASPTSTPCSSWSSGWRSPGAACWIAWDDRSSDDPFGDERQRRKALLDAAVEHGAGWILALDPAERIESALAGRIRDLVRAEGLVAYEFRLRAMFSVTEYRVDAGW